MTTFDVSRSRIVRALPNANKAFMLGVCLAMATAAVQGGRPPLRLHRNQVLRAETDRMMAEAMRPGRDGTCFGAQLDGRPDGSRIAAATVLVAITDTAGSVVSAGTGTVVAGSGGPGSPNRVLTAEHVVRAARVPGAAKIVIAGSNGRYLAIAEPRDASTLAPDEQAGSRGDIAVLTPTQFPPGGEAAYRSIQGLEVVSLPSDRPGGLSGLAGLPAGIDHGASGAAIVDGDGRIRGVVTAGSEMDPSLVRIERVQFTSGDIMAMAMAKDGTFRTAERSLPGWGSFVGEAIPAGLAASLSAGREASKAPQDSGFLATVAGYPGLSCVAYEAVVSLDDPPHVPKPEASLGPGR